MWVFPWGIQPDLRCPVQVYVNGTLQWVGEDVVLARVGRRNSVVAAVVQFPIREGDIVQAVYTAEAA